MLFAASMLAAAVASLILGILTIIVIVASSRLHLNPDNIATPIAAALGDVVTLALLVSIGTGCLSIRNSIDHWYINGIIIGILALLVVPIGIWMCVDDPMTRAVLKHGWYAIIGALIISR